MTARDTKLLSFQDDEAEEEPIQFKKKGIARPDRTLLNSGFYAFTVLDKIIAVVDDGDQLALSINPDIIMDRPRTESKGKQKANDEQASVSYSFD